MSEDRQSGRSPAGDARERDHDARLRHRLARRLESHASRTIRPASTAWYRRGLLRSYRCMTAMASGDIGIVVIGRNEGERLNRCLASLLVALPGAPIVYVDSGSTDNSVAAARTMGADVVELDLTRPFTAARARNAGRAALPPTVNRIQFIDGDCTIRPDWPARASAALAADPGLAAVFGRRREVAPEASVYNWLCDLEWAVPPGPQRQFGGDVMIRAVALDRAGGYPDEMIAGEEPDLSIRLGGLGWRIECLSEEMTVHDAAMTRLVQFWRRAERSGHAYAELDTRHPGLWRRRVQAALFWGAVIPVAAVLLFAAAVLAGNPWLAAGAGGVAALPLAQIVRVARRRDHASSRGDSARDLWKRAIFLMLDKPPHALGILRYHRGRLVGRRSALIEYKQPSRPRRVG